MENTILQIYHWIAGFGVSIIAAIAILLFGKILIAIISKWIVKVMNRRKVDPTIVTFTSSLTKALLWVFIVIAALSQLGFETASFIAVIGAAGLAVGFALQGSLSNFASGVLIILFRPFKVGDAVEAAGVLGAVKRINIFNTVFKTFDNKIVVIPNSQITGGKITNLTAEEERRVDLTVGVSYDSEIEKVKEVVYSVIARHNLILKEPEATVRLAEMADSSLNFTVKVWAKTENYWPVFFDLNEQIKEELDKNNISIPYPQMDVHIKNG